MTAPGLRQLAPDSPELADVLNLIRVSFAFMDGRVDPPSSAHRLTDAALRRQATQGEVWVTGAPVQACMFLTPRDDALYLGKLAVAQGARGRGLARGLVERAMRRAAQLNLPVVELQTRVELTENHQAFARMGFVKTAQTRHAGYDRTTSITMRRVVG